MSPSELLEHAVRAALSGTDRVVLAVSGGCDSMVLLHAAARVARARVVAAVTVDHGTGEAATRAAALVEATGAHLGFEVVRRRVSLAARTEEAWRRARWEVLREVAEARRARVATAHTRDDQAETVLMRIMRQAGARGIAGLAASGSVLRPLLDVDRQAVTAYASRRRIAFREDPSNRDLRHLRNRTRLELLPALERANPGFRDELLALGDRAAEWRREVEAAVDSVVTYRIDRGELRVRRDDFSSYEPAEVWVLWPALAARAGVVLDRRGTERLTSFTIEGRPGTRIQLSGGVEATRHGDELILRRSMWRAVARSRALGKRTRIGEWQFVLADRDSAGDARWMAALPTDRPLRARTWRPGDRIVPTGEPPGATRRVKRLLREAGIEAGIRAGWPVVLSGDEIVWVPGVRRGTAATVRSGRPVAVYRCERIVDS